MSTRACYTFKDKEGAYSVYYHYDGYPLNALQMINKAKAGFNEGGFVVKNLQDLESVKALQQQIKQMYDSEIAVGIRDATDKKFEEIQEEAKQQLV